MGAWRPVLWGHLLRQCVQADKKVVYSAAGRVLSDLLTVGMAAVCAFPCACDGAEIEALGECPVPVIGCASLQRASVTVIEGGIDITP